MNASLTATAANHLYRGLKRQGLNHAVAQDLMEEFLDDLHYANVRP